MDREAARAREARSRPGQADQAPAAPHPRQPAPRAAGRGLPPSHLPALPGPEEAAGALEELRQSTGQALDKGIRAGMEAAIGGDLPDVRVHTGEPAARSAARVSARAYTVGRDVVFGAGAYAPGSPDGRRTIAHELAHAAQQQEVTTRGPLDVAAPDDPLEADADAVAARAVAPRTGGLRASAAPPRPRPAPGLALHRQPLPPPAPQPTPAPPGPAQQPPQMTPAQQPAQGAQPAQQGGPAPGPDLHTQFQRQMGGVGGTPPDFDAAALTLNGMSQSDMDAEVGAVMSSLRVGLFKGAMRTMLLWPPPNRVADTIQRLDLAAARQGRIEYLAEVVAANLWQRAALTLNGFNDEDMRAQLTPLAAIALGEIEQAANHYMAGWQGRVVGAVHAIQSASQMQGMVGQSATWHSSNPHSGNNFQTWASAATEGAAPAVQPATVLNCWEMVMLAAYNAHTMSWAWIHETYSGPAAAAAPDWFAYLVQRMTPSGRQAYTPAAPAGPAPLRGDVVFFNGAAHVALATGTRDATGRTQIYSFWPPPGTAFTPGGTVDAVKTTTIEELRDYMVNQMGIAAVNVEFGRGPW